MPREGQPSPHHLAREHFLQENPAAKKLTIHT
jgi:hypothetical protein